MPWQLVAERAGARLRAIPVTEDGRLDLDRLGDVLTDRTRDRCGHPRLQRHRRRDRRRRAFGEAAARSGPRWSWTALSGHRTGPLDVQALGCDAYAFSAHKMFGPTGAGALWGRSDLGGELPPFLGGGEMIRRVTIERSTYAPPPHRFEAGTPAIGPGIGHGAAARWLAEAQDWEGLAARSCD